MKLSDLVTIKHGFAFKSEFFSDSGSYVLLTPGNFFEEGGFRDQNGKTKYYLGNIPKGYILAKDQILIAMTEQAQGLLGSAILVPEDNKYLHNQRLGLVEIKDKSKVSGEYLYFYFNSEKFRKQIQETASGTKVRHTSPKKITDCEIELPSIEDQKKIAQVLSTWDEAIVTMEKIVEQKKRTKKAMMQKFLESKDFPELVVSKVIQDSITGEYGNDPVDGCPEGYELLSLLRSTNFTNDGLIDFSSVVQRCIPNTKVSKVALQQGNIVLEKSGGSPNQPVGRVVYFDSKDKFGYVNFLQKLVVNPKYDSRYVFYALKQYYESKKVLRYQQQTTGIINFQLNDFLKTAKIRVPDSLQEQQSISSILNNCDNQIQLLIKKKLLLEKQKNGLMQQLLTGKARIT